MARVPLASEVDFQKRKGYNVQLDDMLLRTATGPDRVLQIQSAEFPQQNINLAVNPEDITTNVGQIFSRNNFSGGEGLDTAHKRNGTDDDISRFFDSKGIDVFHGDEEGSYKVHLLNATDEINVRGSSNDLAGSNNYIARTNNGYLYLTDTTNIYLSTDNGGTWSAVSTGLTINNNFTGIAAFGNGLYATTANGTTASELIKYDGSSWSEETTAQTSAGGLTGVWFSKNQLFISGKDSSASYLWAISPFGKTWSSSDLTTASALVVSENTHDITDIVDAGAVVLASSTDGNIYSLKDISGTMTLKGQTHVPFEEVNTIQASEGIILFGTKEIGTNTGRLYRSQLTVADDLYVLADKQLIKEWIISGIDASPKFMFGTRDSIYMGIKESASDAYLWRYYLPTAGLARDLEIGTGSDITGITQSNGQFIIVAAGKDIYKESSTTFVSTGYLILPNADFFTSEQKQWVGAEVEHNELGGGQQIDVFISTTYDTVDNPDSSNWELVGQSVSGTGGVEYELNRNARYVNAKIVLTPNTAFTTSPEFRSIAIRALPRPELVVVSIPINLSDQIERPNRKRLRVTGLGETIYQTLKTKEGDSVTLILHEPSETIRGVVESVQYPIIEDGNLGSVTQYCIVRVRGIRADSTTTSITRLLGVGRLAVSNLG
tara:strand:+ start:373 stop:2358 length:1986 start_codon:yes stop_codon:yes gene_type:complete